MILFSKFLDERLVRYERFWLERRISTNGRNASVNVAWRLTYSDGSTGEVIISSWNRADCGDPHSGGSPGDDTYMGLSPGYMELISLTKPGNWHRWIVDMRPDKSTCNAWITTTMKVETALANDAYDGIRCDQERYMDAKGCVMERSRPVFALSLSGRYPYSAANAHDAIKRGLPGTLTRKYWEKGRNSNRVAAAALCGARLGARPFGYDCDEYPFASSYEGCHFAVCSVRYIPSADNRGSGGALGGFYRKKRILDGDRYRVVVTK
jgi:hypothetical protein